MRAGFALAGRYVLERLLGQGAVGEVWRADDRELDRPVAVKVIRDRVEDPKLAAGLLGEARIAGRLRHPGITVVHDVGEDEGQPFIVMELLAGRDLDAVLAARSGGLPIDEAVLLAIQVADALAAAHAGGVVHRDLKPANLFLQDDGRLKICDFGIAVAADAVAMPTSASYVVGTPAYMSPEQCDGQEASEPGDLYSLGCVLYALLTGGPPFIGGRPLAIMAQHRTALPTGPRALRPAVPAGLDRLVTDLLAKDPAARPESAAQVAVALRALQGELYAAGEAKPEPEPDRPAKAPDGAVRPFDSTGPDAALRGVVALVDRTPAATTQLLAPRRAGSLVDSVMVNSRQLLATIGSDGTVRLWDPATSRQIGAMEGHERTITAACTVTAGGRQLLATAGSDGTVRLWDPAIRQQIAVVEGQQRAISAMCPVTVGGWQMLATAGRDGTVWLWDPGSGQHARMREDHEYTIIAMCSVTVEGRQLLATGGFDGTVRLWDPASGKQAGVLEGHERTIIAMCPVTVGGRHLLATGSNDHTTRLWDPATGLQTAMARSGGSYLDEISGIGTITVGGRMFLVTGSNSGAVGLWDPETGQQIVQMHRGRGYDPYVSGSVTGICSVTVGVRSLVATSHHAAAVRLWDPATRRQVTALRGHGYIIYAVCPVSP